MMNNFNNDAAWSCPCGSSDPADCGRWETNEDCNGYNWIPEYHGRVEDASDHAAKPSHSQCYCSGNDSRCDDCHGSGSVRCG